MSSGGFMAFDVGLNGLGWARWSAARRPLFTVKPVAPDEVGVVEASRYIRLRNTELRLRWMAEQAWSAYKSDVLLIAVEWPNFRAGDAVGHAAASGDSLGVLYAMCGMLQAMAMSHGAVTVHVGVNEWKGQLPKPVVAKRLSAAIGVEDVLGNRIQSHAWDAVGIGLHALGHSINSKPMVPADVEKKGGGRG